MLQYYLDTIGFVLVSLIFVAGFIIAQSRHYKYKLEDKHIKSYVALSDQILSIEEKIAQQKKKIDSIAVKVGFT